MNNLLVSAAPLLAFLAFLPAVPVARGDDKPERVEAVPPRPAWTDQDGALLVPPERLAGSKAFTIAAVPPKITLSTVTGLPELRDLDKKGGLWSLWGEGVVAGNGKYYSALGNHRGIDGNCYLYEYDPVTHAHRQVLDVATFLKLKPGEFGHGKLHGRLDEMPDGWIYFATYWGTHPHNAAQAVRDHVGGRLLAYSTRSGEARDLGMPIPGDSYPMHASDTRRGIFYGLGLWGNWLAYDVRANRSIYAGPLPGDVTWDGRCTLVDDKTGKVYGCTMNSLQIVEYDPALNRFRHTAAYVPKHPRPPANAKPWIRSYTRRRLNDGSFIVQTYDGIMFKFFPDEERIETIGFNWEDGLYATSIALSPHDRYIYYTVGAHGSTWGAGSPIIQMDTRTYARKVIAFLHPFYQEKHGYVFGGSYSTCIDAAGGTLLLTWNGRYRNADEEGESFGHPTFMQIDIPASER